jgi:5-amino-6-(5-phospho-D-ribitylamino)uracil phosphatase
LQSYFFENLYSPGWHWITVSDARATKGMALAELLALRELGGAYVVAFGDHANDLPLFEAASWSCAVANALEVVRTAADETIGSNNDDGVTRWMLRAEGLD